MGKNQSRRVVHTSIWCSVLFVFFVTALYSGGQQLEAGRVKELMDQLKEGQVSAVALDTIARAGLVQAIPNLKEQFTRNQDVFMKEAIASALVRLGEKEELYWDFLVRQATPAIESTGPFPIRFDAHGEIISGQFATDFLEWAKMQGVSPEAASKPLMQDYPLDVTFLAVTGDPRGLPVLRRAMLSQNYFIQAIAAKGLALLQDRESIPVIIEACKRAPSSVSPSIAQALVFFRDPRAQSGAEIFIRDRAVLDELRKLSRDKGPRAVF